MAFLPLTPLKPFLYLFQVNISLVHTASPDEHTASLDATDTGNPANNNWRTSRPMTNYFLQRFLWQQIDVHKIDLVTQTANHKPLFFPTCPIDQNSYLNVGDAQKLSQQSQCNVFMTFATCNKIAGIQVLILQATCAPHTPLLKRSPRLPY